MPFRREIGFALGVIATALILHVLPYDETKVALYRLEDQIQRDVALGEVITRQCTFLESSQNTRASRFFNGFRNLFAPSPPTGWVQ